MARYKVMIFGGMDGLKFPDLLVKMSSGYAYPLSVKQGAYIPTDIFDPLDIRKSLAVGSLGKYLKAGKVLEENDMEDLNVNENADKNVKKDGPQRPQETVQKVAENDQHVDEKADGSDGEISSTIQLQLKEAVPIVEEIQPITDLASVKTVDDFFHLSYFLKLKFIPQCSDKELLEHIMKKSGDSKQLQNNVQVRLSQLK